jgi:hypothetical protein
MPGTAAGAAKAREKLAARRADPNWQRTQAQKRAERATARRISRRKEAARKGAETRRRRQEEERPKPGKPLKGVKGKDLAPGKGEKGETRYWVAKYVIHLRCGEVEEEEIINPMRFPNLALVPGRGSQILRATGGKY